MDTQLVRLDPPYSIIGNKRGEFALHIATLLTIDGTPDTPVVKHYPIVQDMLDLGGVTWKEEFRDEYGNENYIWLCRNEDKWISLPTIKRAMAFFYDYTERYIDLSLIRIHAALIKYGIKIDLLRNKDGDEINNYTVELWFEGDVGEEFCIVASSDDSPFFFRTIFDKDDAKSKTIMRSREEAIRQIRGLRNTYLDLLRGRYVNITFTTKREEYKSFVAELNA